MVWYNRKAKNIIREKQSIKKEKTQMAIDFNAPMTWSEFKELTNTEQHDYLQHLVEEYGANCVSFAQMFHLNANTVRRYIKDNDIGITLTRGRRVNAARWKEFLGETLEETELPAGATPVDRSPNRYADLLSFYAV